MALKPERREDTRYLIDLKTTVTAEDADGKVFSEMTNLRNMSSGGASFVTCCPERYFEGQRLDIKIDLPGAAELSAALYGVAAVFRIERLRGLDSETTVPRYAVAVEIAMPLRFAREDDTAKKASCPSE